MSLRSRFRGSLPYAVAVIGGFLLAYLIVAFLIFPSGVIPGNAKVPNVTGLPFDDAAKRLAEVGFKAERGEARFHAASPKETVLERRRRSSRYARGERRTTVGRDSSDRWSCPG